MNEKQKEAILAVRNGLNVFVTGGAGTGKTFFIQSLVKEFPHANIAITSTTGSSALLINGTTVHSYLGLGILKNELDILKRIIKFKKRGVWITTDILVIDEISMLSKELFEIIDSIAKKLRESDKPFGGMQVVLCGDFCQLGVVGSEDFCFDSFLWSVNIHKTIYLTEVYRQKSDRDFSIILEKIRFGNLDEKIKKQLSDRLIPPNSDKIFPTQLYPFRRNVNNINEMFLERLIQNFPLYEYQIKTTSSFVKSIIPMDRLQLCKHAK